MLYNERKSFDITPLKPKEIFSGATVIEHFLNTGNYFIKIFL